MLKWTYKPTGGVSLYLHSTAGDEGVIADFSSESISVHVQGLPAPVLLPATTWASHNLDLWLISTPFW